MFASNALIGLREGLEAALVVVILVAFLVKTDRRWALRYVWIGVGAAVALSVAVAAGLTLGSRELPESVEETVTGVASLIAVGFVTAMIFWMRATARSVAGDLTGRLGRAVDIGPWAVALVGFLGVGREGLETALFVFASVQAAGEGSSAPLLGWAVGLLAAVALGLAIYQGAVRIDLAKFFRWTGVVLVFVAAGILAYAVHELQEAGWLPGEDSMAFDVTSTIAEDSWFATLVRGMFNLRPAMAVLPV
ncbi:MAG: iron uptake transporter permease EfeU, partial [Candidatus Lutibacillus vidarii]